MSGAQQGSSMGARERRKLNIGSLYQDRSQTNRSIGEVINFNLSNVILNPQYASPTSYARNLDFGISSDGRIAKLPFMNMSSVLKFQQAVTGWKAWAGYSAYDVEVDFVEGSSSKAVKQKASLQLWYAKEMQGNPDIDGEADGHVDHRRWSEGPQTHKVHVVNGAHAARGSVYQSAFPPASNGNGYVNMNGRGGPVELPAETAGPWSNRQQTNIVELPGSQVHPMPVSPLSGGSSPQSSFQSPFSFANRFNRSPARGADGGGGRRPSGADTSPGTRYAVPDTSPSPRGRFNLPISSDPTSPVRQQAAWSPPQSNFLQLPPMSPIGRQQRFSLSHQPSSRSLSVSSTRHSVFSDTSSSTSSDTRTFVTTGTSAVGVLHRAPVKPLLVLFTQDQTSGHVSMVAIKLDEDTDINPERCNCRRGGSEGKRCKILSIEKGKGSSSLDARRWNSKGWNVAPVALSSKSHIDANGLERNLGGADSENSVWPNVKRITLTFPTSDERVKFGGKRNECSCKVRTNKELQWCLTSNHRGLWGEVKDFHRKQGVEYHESRYGGQQSVVWGQVS